MNWKSVMPVVILALFLGMYYLSGNAEKTEEEPIKYGIMTGLESTYRTAVGNLSNEEIKTIAGMQFHEGNVGGIPVVIVKPGAGKVNAAACAATLIAKYNVNQVISADVAGGIDEDMEIGDVIVVKDAVQFDMDASALKLDPGVIPNSGKSIFQGDESMRRLALQAVKEAAPTVHSFEGRLCSGDTIITRNADKSALESTFRAVCFDMGGAAAAQVCSNSFVPFVLVRVISSLPSDTESGTTAKFESEAGERCARIIGYMITP